MLFEDFLKVEAKKVDQALNSLLKGLMEDTNKISPDLTHLIDAFIDAHKGGKKIRGVLVCLGYSLAGKKPPQDLYKVASALEIFHTSIIAHDDIIDKSKLRRGILSLYESLGGNHYGISQAISLADLGFFLSFKIISETNFPSEAKNQVLTFLSNLMIQTAQGEMLDIEIPNKNIYQQDSIIKIALLKTAQYSISGPLILGAMLSGANKKLMDSLQKIGDNLGIAYQIHDDILGIFGDSTEMGKSSSSDIQEGKATLLISHALEKAGKSESDMLKKLYGNPDITEVEIEHIKQIFIKTAALDFAKSKEVEYAALAQNLIDKLALDKDKKELLINLADFMIERSK